MSAMATTELRRTTTRPRLTPTRRRPCGTRPPGTTARKVNYLSYMGAIGFAAIDLNFANIPAAEKAMTGASTYRDKVDAVVAACAGS